MSLIVVHTSRRGASASRACRARTLLAGCCIATLGGCGDADDDLPPIVASSEYIDFSTRADTSVLCLDDRLARLDRFIEDTASFLGVDPPHERVRYVWDPFQQWGMPETFVCEDSWNCFRYQGPDSGGLILSVESGNTHELVHAVEIGGLGLGHRMLIEGLAEYLGTMKSSAPALADFPSAFHAALARSPGSEDYPVALHFVGSLVAAHGVDRYRQLRALLAEDASPAEFAAAFESVYATPLDDALQAMVGAPVIGRIEQDGCTADDIEVVLWTSPDAIDARIRGECGDPWFVGSGFVDDRLGFAKLFAIEVTQAGWYELKLTATEGEVHPEASLIPCTSGNGLSGFEGLGGAGPLEVGRHILAVGFPQAPEPRGEARLELKPF